MVIAEGKMGLKTKKALALRAELKKHWEKHLKKHNLPYPEGDAHEPGLLALYEAMPNALTQDELTTFYEEHSDNGYNKQLRHLASAGWDIRSGNSRFTQGIIDRTISRNQMRLAQVESPHEQWLKSSRLKRTGAISELDWNAKLELYKEHGCAVCGQKFQSYDKGHLDPHLGYSNANIVPMCSPCNNWAQDRVAFKLYGLIARPIYIREKDSDKTG